MHRALSAAKCDGEVLGALNMSNSVTFANKEELQKAVYQLLRRYLPPDHVVYSQDAKEFKKIAHRVQYRNLSFGNLLADYRKLLLYYEPVQSGH